MRSMPRLRSIGLALLALAGAAAGLGVLSLSFATCSDTVDAPSTSAPASEVVRVGATDLALEDALDAMRKATAAEVLPAVPDDPADVVFAVTADAEMSGSSPFVRRYWAPVVAPSHPATEISMAQLGEAFAGRLTDWSSITGEARPLEVVAADTYLFFTGAPFTQWWADLEPNGVGGVFAESLLDSVGDLSVLELMPLSNLDARVRPLTVDGVNIVFGEGDPAAYPLVERAWVTPRTAPDAGDELRDAAAEAARAIAARLSVAPPDPIVLRATGDILPVRCALARMRALGDLGHAFRELGPWLAEADITAGSLDAAVSDAGAPYGCVETFSLLAPAASVEGFAHAGIDVMTVATNHVKDCGMAACGDQAFLETLANLRYAGVEPVGGGFDLAEARRPTVIERQGVRFAFLGYDEILPGYHAGPSSPGTAPLEEAVLREDVTAAKAQADVVVVMPQWGVEYTADPNERQRALARAAVEAGADLVIGNHPHWVQAAEVIDGAFVAYALGNFVFDQDWSLETQQGVVLEASFLGDRLAGVRYHPVHIFDEHQPRFAEPAEARQILDRIWNASQRLAEQ